MCCIQYLCQRHHDPDLLDDEFLGNVLSGAYRMHEYAVSMWLELVERYVLVADSPALPENLIGLLQLLIEKRSSDDFIEEDISQSLPNLSQDLLVSDCSDVSAMLRKASYFRQKCSEGEYDKRYGKWMLPEPS